MPEFDWAGETSPKAERHDLETTIDGLREQANEFLEAYGFPVNDRYRQKFGQYIQALPADQTYYYPEEAAIAITRGEINEAAFFLIYPSKYEELKAFEAKKQESANEAGQQEVPSSTEDVVPEAG